MSQQVTWEKRTLEIEVPTTRESDPKVSSLSLQECWDFLVSIPATKTTVEKKILRFDEHTYECVFLKMSKDVAIIKVTQLDGCLFSITIPLKLNDGKKGVDFFQALDNDPMGILAKRYLETCLEQGLRIIEDTFYRPDKIPSHFWEAIEKCKGR